MNNALNGASDEAKARRRRWGDAVGLTGRDFSAGATRLGHDAAIGFGPVQQKHVVISPVGISHILEQRP
jgi:hypothetical protein